MLKKTSFTSPQGSRTQMRSTTMKNLLFISSYPLPLYKGSNQHAYFFLKSLVNNFNVYCIFFVQPENEAVFEDNIDSNTLGIKKYEICYFKENPRKNKYYERIRKNIEFPYRYMNLATHSHGKRIINTYIKRYSIDIIHFEHFHYVKYAFFLPPDIKKIVVYHDLYHSLGLMKIRFENRYINKLELLLGSVKQYLFERILDSRISLKVFLNPIEMLSLPNKSICIPHIVNPEIQYNKPDDTNFINILFLGGYNHPPNRLSFKYIIDSVLPLLVKKQTNFKIWVIGPGAEKYNDYLSQFRDSKFFCIKNFVPDINDVFKNIDIALYPILYGGGIKTKVIETMAAGIPIVTTMQGVFGLSGLPKNCVDVCKTPTEFVNELVLLMNNYSLRLNKSLKGREYVEREHSVQKLSEKVNKVYQNTIAK